MSLQKVGNFSLHNGGGFVARMKFAYIDDEGQKKSTRETGDILLGQTKTAKLEEFDILDGALVYLHVDVVWGKDNEAARAFTYERGNTCTAAYTITGTTLSNTLGLIDVNC